MPGGPSCVSPRQHDLQPQLFVSPAPGLFPGAGLLPHFSTVPVWLIHPAWARENLSEGPMVAPQNSTPGRDPTETKQYPGIPGDKPRSR